MWDEPTEGWYGASVVWQYACVTTFVIIIAERAG
jgi:hypothetical protein